MPAKKSVKKVAPKTAVQLDPSKYRTVLAQAELIDVKLTDLNFKVDPAFFAASAKKSAEQREFSFRARSVSIDPSGTAIGVFEGSLSARHERKVVLALSAEFVVVFDVKDVSYEAEIEAYVEQVGRLAAYPYYRQLVASTSNMANARLPTLPVIKEWANVTRDKTVRKSE